MSNEIQIFEYMQSQKIRTVTKEDEVWFVAADVCDILGLTNPTKAISELDEEDKNTLTISEGIRGNPNMNVISEQGLLELICKSRKPDAKKFKRWIFSEVIPSVISKGYYIDKKAVEASPEKADALYDDAQTIRTEERIFFAKVKQYFTMAEDYDPTLQKVKDFFARLQNIFLVAVTGKPAANIVTTRIDHTKDRCGMVQDVAVTKSHLAISKNYLDVLELKQLKTLCDLYLNCLESFKIRSKKVTMDYLMTFFDDLLRSLNYNVMGEQHSQSVTQRDRVVQREYVLYKQRQIA